MPMLSRVVIRRSLALASRPALRKSMGQSSGTSRHQHQSSKRGKSVSTLKVVKGSKVYINATANVVGATVAPTTSSGSNVSCGTPVLISQPHLPDQWQIPVTGVNAGTDTVTVNWVLNGVTVTLTQSMQVLAVPSTVPTTFTLTPVSR